MIGETETPTLGANKAGPGRYQRILRAVAQTPWAILPGKFGEIVEFLAFAAAGGRYTDAEVVEIVGARRPSQAVMAGDVAVIPVYGVMAPKANVMTDVSGGTSVSEFQRTLAAAATDSQVKGILLDMDSPGGSVELVPEAAQMIREARARKPVVAVANTMAASAAYWLASQASEVVASPSAQVGSIGVFAAHDDLSAALEQAGVKTTLISAGKYKTEANPFEPLSDEARAAIQDSVNQFYGMFVRDVAAGRKTNVDAVRGGFGEGRVLTARDALRLGMVDRIEPAEGALARLAQRVRATQVAFSGSTHFSVELLEELHRLADERQAGWSTAQEVRETYGFPLDQTSFEAGPIPAQDTPVIDEPWDANAQVGKMPDPCGSMRGRRMYAWMDPEADPDTKAAYKFPHHMVGDMGMPGPANVNGVRNALSRLPQADIPEADRAGVERHLQRHLDRFNNSNSDADENTEAPAAQHEDGATEGNTEEPTTNDGLAELKRISAEAMQTARDNKVRLTKAMLAERTGGNH